MPRNQDTRYGRRGERRGGGKPKEQRGFSRDYGLLLIFALFCTILIAMLVYVQVVKGAEYGSMAESAHLSETTVAAKRGTIYDRNGEVLASNIDATTIYTDPTMVTDASAVAKVLEEVLGKTYKKDYDDYYALVTKDNHFTYIQRKADPDLADKLKETLKAAELDGIYYMDDTKRVYPYGDVASQVVGNIDIDGNGIAGLEMEYDDLVGGTDGEMIVEQGRYGIPISNGSITKTDAVDGSDIVTSLDIKLQEDVEKSLLKRIKKYEAKGGNALVMDASTGEIYAAASYSKNSKGKYKLDVGKLSCLTDAYEPGSTFKTVTAASILSNSSVTLKSSFSVPDSLKVYDATITDSHSHSTDSMSFKRIIAESSNVGTVLASRKVSKKKLYKTYSGFGFGTKLATDFPGVASGQLQKSSDWDPVRQANITFGQGLTVTNAQLARAYGAIEQGGTAHVPHFLTSVANDDEKTKELTGTLTETKTVTDKKTCKNITKMLRSVVTDGTGSAAAMDGFKVVGKTGTAEVAENGSYGSGYIVSFCGWLEGSSSDLVCIVSIEKPKTEEGGGPVCGPVFADIMSFAAERYQVNPNAD